jgi:hypothetical protein
MGPGAKHQSRIVVVTRETRMKGLLQRWGTKGQVRFYFGQARAVAAAQAGRMDEAVDAQKDFDQVFDDLEVEDATYHDAVRQLTRQLDFGLPVQVIDRTYVPTIDFQMYSVVVVVGQDGLVANTAKYVGDVPIVAVNPDPARFDGVLLPFRLANARAAVSRVLKNQARFKEVTLAQATLHDGQSLLAFNDLFIGAASHVSARYELRIGDRQEPQSSSGILVSTGAGSTGWMSSVFNMTRGVSAAFGQPLDQTLRPPMDWGASWLLWAVREPFLSRTSGVSLVAGRLDDGEDLIVESRMSTGGVIFSDGIEADFLTFNGGAIVTVQRAKHRARLVVPTSSAIRK